MVGDRAPSINWEFHFSGDLSFNPAIKLIHLTEIITKITRKMYIN